ncbi:MAG: hypothetical protein JXB85_11070 [Anaerolineales bacterium]|nr:hypothetical protein [Anaerolineales bacterium]
MRYFLGIDGGGSKTHALIADETGTAVGFAVGGPGSQEVVGYDGLQEVFRQVTTDALQMAGINVNQIAGAGFGLAGYDWPSQRPAHLEAIASLGLQAPLEVVNDATLGIVAGALEGWGISVVSGTGCNCRGWTRDRRREGRAVGGMSHWSDEYAGGWDIAARGMRAVSFEWTRRGPATALTPALLERTGARDLDDLVEGAYVGKYDLHSADARLVFDVAHQGDPAALEVVRWAGQALGDMACGVIRQLELETLAFDVVLIGSLHDGHPLMRQALEETIQRVAPQARLVRLSVPPVVGGVLLGMEMAGLDGYPLRETLVTTTEQILEH